MRVFTQVLQAKYDSSQPIARCLGQLAGLCLILVRALKFVIRGVLFFALKLIFLPLFTSEAVEIDLADVEESLFPQLTPTE
jgi:hypothetical protein